MTTTTASSAVVVVPAKGILLATRTVVVIEESDVRRLWALGNYGCSTRSTRFKPSFLEEPKKPRRYNNNRKQQHPRKFDNNNNDNEEEKPHPQSLQLNLMESYHLVRRGELEVVDSATGRRFASLEELETEFAKRYEDDEIGFAARLEAYLAFRHSQWYTKTGTQYGCDYVLYANDIDRCHSTYCVHLTKPPERKRKRCDKSLVDVLRLMRVAEQTRKRAVLWDARSGEGVQLRRYVLKQEQQQSSRNVNNGGTKDLQKIKPNNKHHHPPQSTTTTTTTDASQQHQQTS